MPRFAAVENDADPRHRRGKSAAEGREVTRTPGEEVIDTMVELGRKGRAAGAGMYDYPEGSPKVLWP